MLGNNPIVPFPRIATPPPLMRRTFPLFSPGVYGILVALVLPNGSPLARLFQFASDPTIVAPLPPYPSQWKAVLLVAALLNTAVAVAVEKVLILGPGAEYCRRRRKRDHHIPLRC